MSSSPIIVRRASTDELAARFHSLVDLVPVGIIETDPEGNRVFCNARWLEMTGLTLEQALGDVKYQSIHPDDLAIARHAWDRMIETGQPFHDVIFRYQRPDGSSVWVSGSGTPIYDHERKVTGYLGSTTNIEEQVAIQAALRESEARYRTVINAMSEGVVMQAQDGTIDTCNPAAERILGLTADQMMGRTSLDPRWQTIHEDGSPFPGETHPSYVTLKTGVPQSNVIMGVYKPDSTLSWLKIDSRPIFQDNATTPSAVVITFVEITEMRAAQQALQQERDLLRMLIDNTPDYIFIKDREGRFILSNEAHARAAGNHAPRELIGKTAFDLFPPDLAARFHADDQALMQSGESLINAERQTVDDTGQPKTVLTTKIPWRAASGEILGLVGMSRDITERSRLEEVEREQGKLQAKLEKEQELSTLKTRMMERIAHEFRTPLTVIQSSTESLSYYLDRLSADQRTAKFNMIGRQIGSITTMLDQIGLVINGNFKPSKLYRDWTDIAVLCQQAATDVEAQVNQKDRFALEMPASAIFYADEQVIRAAIIHILRNAVRFSSDSIMLQLEQGDSGITLRVVDTGIGILPDEQQRIFEPFYRGSNIDEIGGLGLGLTLAQAAIEAHNGTIRVSSAPAQGTIVTVWLPTPALP
jgi:PAS domain S-box-containing protein